MKLSKEQINRLTPQELKDFLKTSKDSELSEVAQSIIKKKQLDLKSVETIKTLLK